MLLPRGLFSPLPRCRMTPFFLTRGKAITLRSEIRLRREARCLSGRLRKCTRSHPAQPSIPLLVFRTRAFSQRRAFLSHLRAKEAELYAEQSPRALLLKGETRCPSRQS